MSKCKNETNHKRKICKFCDKCLGCMSNCNEGDPQQLKEITKRYRIIQFNHDLNTFLLLMN
ncbi:hypothetical protein BC833DRAFT_592533 [Globomyces pollinis-pini]|nr:hypothetical protein BC833DRAFT_592533 [Globomyces pollinis-pini]